MGGLKYPACYVVIGTLFLRRGSVNGNKDDVGSLVSNFRGPSKDL